MIKVIIPDILLVEWFTKSLLPPITRDVAMGGAVTEEQAISQAQYLDLVYSQSGTLYDFLPNAAQANTIHLSRHPHLMQMVLSVPSKLNLLPNRPHSPLPPPKIRSLR
jgi:hypothetical protein